IDVVEWDEDVKRYVANALSPAQVSSVETNDEEKTATVVVPDRQLSLAIGKEGQNARLAAKLTGWRIDIKSDIQAADDLADAAVAAATALDPVDQDADAEILQADEAKPAEADGLASSGVTASSETPST
ncbi:MAG: transcription termination/antitermination protein NusA, partial [Chloroflexota bacterium]